MPFSTNAFINHLTDWFVKRSETGLTPSEVADARRYIAFYWQQLERNQPKDNDSLIGMPHPYLVPAHNEDTSFDFNEMYYWDSYFMVQGLLDKEHQAMVEGILDNLCYLFERFDIVPLATRSFFTGRSQPPLLTSFIFDVYHTYGKNKTWLKKHMAVAEKEYQKVWLGQHKPHDRLAYKGLSRYYSIDLTHDQAETESGWDYTPRFSRHALDYLPVDLNAFLYKYERDFADAARIAGSKSAAKRWDEAADSRRQTINELMWDESRGLFYDYDYSRHKRGNVSSLAAYAALWSGLASEQQAQAMVKAMARFEVRGGLTTTDDIPLNQRLNPIVPLQWAYPNGWAPLHFLTVRGLERYGYHDDAKRIATKWLRTNLIWFEGHGVFLEKYNVVEPDKPPTKGVYPSQTGFGWTNAVFERFCRDYVDVV